MDLTTKEPKYWQSIAQFNQDPEFLEKAKAEFQSSPIRDGETIEDGGFNRRDFMKLMAASTALASSACFEKPKHKILPYVNQPEEITFGIPNYYASTCGECATGCGTLVKTREGRPIKIEGNPDHPMNKGALCARGQASILNLYDPDRLRNPVTVTRGSLDNHAIGWADVDKKIAEKLKVIKNGSGKIRILTSTINSPSQRKLINEFLKGFSHGAHVMFDSISLEHISAAQEMSYGTKVIPRYAFDKADVIVSIDADFLGTWLSPVEFSKQFSSRRKLAKGSKMSKLITFESVVSITGTNSDHRIAIRPQDGAAIALALANELVSNHGASVDGETAIVLKDYTSSKVASSIGFDAEMLKKTANYLWAARGKSLVVAGSESSQTENALTLQLAVNILNSLLQNDGVTVDGSASPSLQSQGSYTDLIKLIKDMNNGDVEALFISHVNPVYSLPKELGFGEATKKVGLVISFNDRMDESAALCDYVLPDNHPLESWGDAEPQKGLFSLVQPTIRPIYDTRCFADSLIELSKAANIAPSLEKVHDFHEYIQNNWRDLVYKDHGMSAPFEMFWETALRDGVFDSLAHHGHRDDMGHARTLKGGVIKTHLPKDVAGDYTVALYSKISMHDGQNANNPWLQELPDPVTRVTWDNYAKIAPATAAKLHLTDGALVRIKVNEKTVELPVLVQPGMHEKVIGVAVGYGREIVGNVGQNIGQNMFSIVRVSALNQPVMAGFGATMVKTGATYILASVQEHHTIDARPIIKESTLAEWEENPAAGNEEKEELTTIWNDYEYKGNRWAMAIDLNSCTGCSACVVACTAENNVPVVGKDGVYRGRIMHWLRIDRYYSGTPDNPKVVHQPMLCQHCENAPCETVCPVIATMHDDEGLNSQIYNRCVGTRYCANNCPYKVRRFNWFDYNYGGQVRYPQTLQQNPEVTVRARGIMEKCSFCVQRIHDGKNRAKDLGRPVKDGEIKTACQQSCPTDAIVFGNINDKESQVTELAKGPRGFHVLEELNTRPSITYLTKIRNVEPKA